MVFMSWMVQCSCVGGDIVHVMDGAVFIHVMDDAVFM